MRTIDLRRDTITLPTEKMKERAFNAELGDSIYGEDVNQAALEEIAAEKFGKERALFFPSGTMANLAALLSHTERGDEVILEENAHIRTSETGGAAAVAGLMIRPIKGESGLPSPEAVRAALKPEDIHHPVPRLLCMENSHYRYGGIVPSKKEMEILYELAKSSGLMVHLDGARIFHAALFLKKDVKELAACADTVMAALSKGLAAPVGSLLCGSKAVMKKAERYRKMLGGGMRQTGWLCACGIEALSPENIQLLERDHRNARLLGETLKELNGCVVDLSRVQTNFLDFTLGGEYDVQWVITSLEERGILVRQMGKNGIRCCFSREVSRADTETVCDAVKDLLT